MNDGNWSEIERLAALRRYDILDTAPEPEFDDAVALVKTICHAPIALISLVDDCRQWFKAKLGVDVIQTDIETSVCLLAMHHGDIFVVNDLAAEPRTADMSLVTGAPFIRFYAGVPLVTSDGLPLGSICAIDLAPRAAGLSKDQEKTLKALARHVTAQIELRGAISSRDKAIADQARRQQQATRDSAILHTMLQAQQRVLQAGGDFETVLKTLAEAVLEAISPADGVVVEMRDGDELVYRAGAGTARGRLGLRVPISGSFSGLSFTTETTIVTADATTDDRADNEPVRRLGIRSLVAVPMSRHGKIFGVLKLHATAPGAFKSRHVLTSQILAGLIAASFAESAEAAALKAIERTELRYRHIVDSAIDSAIISTDLDGVVTSWSKGAETIMGWTELEMLGQSLSRIFTPEDLAADHFRSEMSTSRLFGRASCARWHLRKDGGRYYAQSVVTPLSGGAGKGFVKSLRDVTEEHQTRTALEASRLRLDTALETGLIGFFHWDVRNDRVIGDSRFAEFFGLDREAAEQGVPVRQALLNVTGHDRAAIEASLMMAITINGDYAEIFRTFRKDGGARWLSVRGHCIESEADRPLIYVGTAVDITQQKETEENLRLSGERLELATRAAALGSFDYLPQEGALYWDDRCRALFGLSPGVPVTYESAFLPGLHPDDLDRTSAAVKAALDPEGDGAYEVEYRTIGIEDGVERVVMARGMARFAKGVAVRLTGTVQDVTADRKARDLLRETEERFRLAARATNDTVWDWDLRSDHVQWNEALETVYGHKIGLSGSGSWWLAHIHPEDRARVEQTLRAVLEGDYTDWTSEYRFQRADGRYADVRDRGYVIRDAQRRATRMVGAMMDQSDRKQIERHLKRVNESLEVSVSQRTQELQRLWDTSPDLLLMIGFDGAIHRVNPAWKAILGYRPEELLGQDLLRLVHPDDAQQTIVALNEAIAGRIPSVENRYLHKDGGYRWFAWVAAPTGRDIYATGRHITAEKEAQAALRRTEDQLRQSQKVEAIGQLTGGVAHDFNNLLTVIRGSVDLLRRPNITDEKRTRFIDAIADTAERAAKLTSQLLAFARRSALRPEKFDVGASILGLSEMIQTLAGSMIRLKIDVAPDGCHIHADMSQFDTAIINMAANARDAMNRQGNLSISVRPVATMPAMRGQPVVAGDFVAVSISDTGSGIEPGKIDSIFEPFFTTKAVGQGTGLGLSQVFGFAKQSGGEIEVVSQLGEGSVFTLYLPRVAPAQTVHPVTAGVDAGPTDAIRILVVEDNVDVGAFAMQALTGLGHTTTLAASAEEALICLAGDGTVFDIVFSDVVMPGMTGVELAQEIRRRYPSLPVLLTSGYSSDIVAEGTHGFQLLQKPYTVDALSKALQHATGRGAAG